MAITRIGEASALADNVTLPAHQTGDLIVIFSYQDGVASAPSLPSGYSNIFNVGAGGTAQGVRVGYKVAASNSETSGSWTNATIVIAHVLRGTDTSVVFG